MLERREQTVVSYSSLKYLFHKHKTLFSYIEFVFYDSRNCRRKHDYEIQHVYVTRVVDNIACTVTVIRRDGRHSNLYCWVATIIFFVENYYAYVAQISLCCAQLNIAENDVKPS